MKHLLSFVETIFALYLVLIYKNHSIAKKLAAKTLQGLILDCNDFDVVLNA